MTCPPVPSYERREQTYTDAELERARAVADADALVYCPDCETSHPATRSADGYELECPSQ